ncbi:hypothetical protein LINPERPRIM_LOCUS17327, partial [Linum perenne]
TIHSADSPFSLSLLFSSLFSPFSLFPSSSSPDPSSSLLSPKEGNQKQNKPFRPLPQGAVVVAAADSSHHRRRSIARRRVPPPSRHRPAFAVAAADEALIHRRR